ncbi:MAG: tetratricopeptide repeat protein [Halioglobus sp.]|nr:tetratricopeptide repeat protein [Halioglobus sp.]
MKLNKVVVSVIGVATVLLLAWHSRVNAEVVTVQQPGVLERAERALERDDPAGAVALLQDRVVDLRRTSYRSDAYGILCRAHYQLGEYVQAEQACDLALDSGGKAIAWSHLNNRGVMRMAQGRLEEAIADFHAAQRINPRARSVRSNLAMAERLKRAQPMKVSAAY